MTGLLGLSSNASLDPPSLAGLGALVVMPAHEALALVSNVNAVDDDENVQSKPCGGDLKGEFHPSLQD